MNGVILWDFDGTLAECDAVWMIGDNYDADVAGAEAAGISAILARRRNDRATRRVETLDDVDRFVA